MFVLASLLGRGLRFFIVATLLYLFEEEIREFISEYFNLFSIVFVILLILGFYTLRYILPRLKIKTDPRRAKMQK